MAPVNLWSTGPILEPSPSCSTSIPGPSLPPVLSLCNHPSAPAWAALPLQLSPLSRLQSLPPPTECLSAPAAPSGCWHVSRAAGLARHVWISTCLPRDTRSSWTPRLCCVSVFHILGASLCFTTYKLEGQIQQWRGLTRCGGQGGNNSLAVRSSVVRDTQSHLAGSRERTGTLEHGMPLHTFAQSYTHGVSSQTQAAPEICTLLKAGAHPGGCVVPAGAGVSAGHRQSIQNTCQQSNVIVLI